MRSRTAWVALLMTWVSGCGGGLPLQVLSEIPEAGASFPYGMLVLDIETGDTRNATVVFKQIGYIDRQLELQRDGVSVVRIHPGTWRVQVTGDSGSGSVITFAGRQSTAPAARGPSWWPEKPLLLEVRRNHLTDGGRICAHKDCVEPWVAVPRSEHDSWLEMNRLIRYEAAPYEEEEKDEDEEDSGEESASESTDTEETNSPGTDADVEEGNSEPPQTGISPPSAEEAPTPEATPEAPAPTPATDESTESVR